MLDLVLAIAHHLAVFSLVAVMAAEYALLRSSLAGGRLDLLSRVDGLYGALAVLVIIAGVLRVIFGAVGWHYYVTNWVFWAKMGAFILIGVLSAPASVAIARWRKEAKALPAFEPPADGVARARTMMHVQFVVLAFIPAFAAAMARGYGVV